MNFSPVVSSFAILFHDKKIRAKGFFSESSPLASTVKNVNLYYERSLQWKHAQTDHANPRTLSEKKVCNGEVYSHGLD